MEVVSLIISVLALGVSAYIGICQVRISKVQAAAQNKVELYLSSEPATLRKADGSVPDKVVPCLFIRNVGNNVVYLDKYIFNGREYPLNKEVLPPTSSYSCYHYIYLPTDNTIHVSLAINFYDWQNQLWKTEGYADFRNGLWEITYSPCERQ